jgi:RNA polymerase-binding transcription factor DksA
VGAPSRFPKESTVSLTLNSPAATTPAPAQTWDPFRVLLEEQRADCLQQRELALAEAATSVPDPVAQSRAASLALTIDEIDAALHRITEGTYGACVHCGIAIPTERLEFRPFAAGCVACQSSVR